MSWTTNAIIYQIYPRSFKDSNGDGIGDIAGIIEKIDYLKELGVDAVWLSPIYKSPQKDYGYDVSDYRDIDPIFGTLAQFDELVEKLHKNNIKIIMDFIPNHTSDQHPWFLESRINHHNPKRDWYIWAEGKNDGPPNNWVSCFGGSAWTRDAATNQYYYHAFDNHQPDLNWRNKEVREEMFDIMHFWLSRGIDGFRIDAVDYLIENQNLRDEFPNPEYSPGYHQHTSKSLLHTHTRSLPESIDLLRDMAKIIREYEDKFMTTEAIDATLSEVIQMYKKVDWEAYHPFNFSLVNLPWLADLHKQYIDEYENSLSEGYIPNYVVGNHDKPRVVTRLGSKQARNAAILLMTLRGNAFVYNGDEIGMRNRKIPLKYATDTYDLHSPGLGLGRNGERTPIQWDETKNAGFTNGKPWLPIAFGFEKTNVKHELNSPRSFLNLYKQLIRLKKENEALVEGEYVSLPSPAHNVFAYVRRFQDSKILVLINFGKYRKKISLNFKGEVILNNFLDRQSGHKINLNNFVLRADEGIVLKI